jgi:probable rRNA maturation factor
LIGSVQVEINIQAKNSPIPDQVWQEWLEGWLTYLQPQISPQAAYELSLRLTDDLEIQRFNAQYRQQDCPTDVLAFAALEDPLAAEIYEAGEPVDLGDIIISVETAQRQAQEQAHPLEAELAWLAAHGLLHLLGWDHPDAESLDAMLDLQSQLLSSAKIKYAAKL